jgi:nitrogenase iron protein NifH
MSTMATGSIRQAAFYGKGGIGKSTVVANVSAALATRGLRVLQIGCDPKHDSSRPFWDGKRPTTVIDLLRLYGDRSVRPADFVRRAACGVDYIEVGGPEPGVGCAGRGILKMFEIIDETPLLRTSYDVVLYDVLGDVVCGGFAAPLRSGHAGNVYVVLSGELMALYAANNICRGIAKYAARREVRLGGLVLNCREVPREPELAAALARALGSRVAVTIPRSPVVARAEQQRRTVIELYPDSEQAAVYRAFAAEVLAPATLCVPTPLTDAALETLFYDAVADGAPADAPPAAGHGATGREPGRP